MKSRSSRCLGAVLAVTAFVACQAREPWVDIHGQRFYVEIADDEASRMRGLMFRDELPRNRGMLFVWRQEEPRAFWMKNTRIPLDIIYLDGDFRVVSIAAETPPCRMRRGRCPSYPSAGPAQYVLELNAGMSAELDLKTGDSLTVGGWADHP